MLQLFTLGELKLARRDGTLLSRRRTPLVLLAYLSRRAGRPIPRGELAALLWGERAEEKARHSLRQALLELGRLVDDRLEITPETVCFNPHDFETDVDQFERDVESRRDADAVSRWLGDFLQGVEGKSEMALDLWLETERAGLRRLLTLAYDRLLDDAANRGASRDAIALARRWVEISPLDEHACQRLIESLRRAGQSADALSAHTQFTARLRETVHAAPSREFLALASSLDVSARGDGARSGRSSVSSPISVFPLVGRARVLGVLHATWRIARGGSPAVVSVMASHGMGATRLLEQFVRSTRLGEGTTLVLHGSERERAHSDSNPAPYELARSLLRDLGNVDALGGLSPETLGLLTHVVPTVRERFPHVSSPHVTPSEWDLATAVRDALEAAAEDAPVLLIADALAHADAQSRALFAALSEMVRGGVMLLLVLAPDDEGRELLGRLRMHVPSLREITLDPLTTEDVGLLLDAVSTLPPAERATLAQRIHQDTNGVPLYATTVIEALLDERLLTPDVMSRLAGRDLPVPSRVRNDVRRRMRSVDEDAQRAFETAAVLGAAFDAADVVRLDDLPEATAVDALAALERVHLIRADGERYLITPPVVARAAYALVPPLRRESLHGAAAQMITTGSGKWNGVVDSGARAAYHRERAGTLAPAEPRRPPHARRRKTPFAVAGVLILAALTSIAYWMTTRQPPVAERSIAIFPFAVSGSSSIGYLHAGMVDLLSTSLDGVGGYHTIDPRAVIAATKSDVASGAMSIEAATRIAQRLGATYFVTGTVIGAGGRVQVVATLHDTRRNGVQTARASAFGGEDALFGIVDRVTAQLAVAQGAASGERLAQLAAVTTSSLDALKAYLEARSAYRSNDLGRAMQAYERAVGADSSFALAWYGLASAASWLLRSDLEQRAASQAVKQASRLSERDRTLVRAVDAYARGVADSAEQLAVSIAETYDDVEAWVLLGEVLYHHNWKRGRSLSESRRAWQRVLTLDRTHWPALRHLSEVASIEGRVAEADSLLTVYERNIGAEHMFLASRALRAYGFGDDRARAALIPALNADRGFFLTGSIWYVAVYGRDVTGARSMAQMLVEPLRPPDQQGFGRILLAHLDLARGKWREARAQLAIAKVHTPTSATQHHLLLSLAPFLSTPDSTLVRLNQELASTSSIVSNGPATLPWPQMPAAMNPLVQEYLTGMVAARLKDDGVRSRSITDLLTRPDPTGPSAMAQGFIHSLNSEQLRLRGRHEAALVELERGARQTPFVAAWVSAFVSQAYERYLRAELLRELGRDDEALRWYQTLGENSPYDLVYLGPSLYRQAQIHERRGNTAAARAAYQRFVALWSDADHELRPWVDEARTKIANR